MSKKIIAFAGSNSKTSINKQLATYAASLSKNVPIEVLDLNDFELPTYSVDIEKASGIPNNAKLFFNKMTNANGFIVSLAEHNGAYTSVFKSLFDWVSRIEVKLFQEKPMLLMSTAPGPNGGQSVFKIAESRFPRHNADIVSKFILPSFKDNFKNGRLVDPEFNKVLVEAVTVFEQKVLNS